MQGTTFTMSGIIVFQNDFLQDNSDAINSVSWKTEIPLYVDACGTQSANS